MPSIKQYLEALNWAGIKIQEDDAKRFASVFFSRSHNVKQIEELYQMVLNDKKPDINRTPTHLTKKQARKHTALMKDAEKFWSPLLKNMDYSEFLKTPYWHTVRHIKIMETGDRCECCGAKFTLQIHHLSYEARGRDHRRTDLLTVLCEKCHSKRHRIN